MTSSRYHACLWLVAVGLACGPLCSAEEVETRRLVVRADEAFEQGQGAWGVKLNDAGAVGLYDRVLVEDDGPGIGSDAPWLKTDRAPTIEIAGSTRIKKVLCVERLGAKEARLYVPAGVTVEVNGRAIDAPGGTPFPQIPVALLKPGDNQVVLYCSGSDRRNIKIALPEDLFRNAPDRKDRPPRSFKSIDGGKTWQRLQGECMVRLHLVQYVPQGHFISPVIDLAMGKGTVPFSSDALGKGTVPFSSDENRDSPRDENRDSPRDENRDSPRLVSSPVLSPVSIRSVALAADADTPDGTRVELAVRTGRSPVCEPALWSDWQPAGKALPKGNRYVQWKAALFSGDPAKTPSLRSVSVQAEVSIAQTPAWARSLHAVSFHNEEIRSTSLPFEYEDPRHPRMVALRRKYKLDDVVSGAATETERLVRLRDWVAHQWKYQPPAENYPAWDADEILTRKYGFCVQYAVVLMQTAISLGHQARFVFGHNPGAAGEGGHEVCEIWSNEHRKWMFFDVNQNWHYVDPKTNVPMSMLEVHDLILKTYYAGRPATLENRPGKRRPSDAVAICYGTNMAPGPPPKSFVPPKDFATHFADGRYTVPTRWLLVSYMPRNNFYAKPYPQPKTQGAHWDWSEYWCWEDAATPKQWLYRNFTARRSDLNWTINQVRFDATLADRAGALQIQMGTFTPYFDRFLVAVDRQGWKESPPAFAWELHAGRNRLQMRVRNQAGVEGPVSFLEMEYRP